jgi:hypothetical protein
MRVRTRHEAVHVVYDNVPVFPQIPIFPKQEWRAAGGRDKKTLQSGLRSARTSRGVAGKKVPSFFSIEYWSKGEKVSTGYNISFFQGIQLDH